MAAQAAHATIRVMNWDTLHDLVALRERATRRPSQPDAAWSPNVDLLETATAFLLVAELPGLGADDFRVSATGDGLVLTGQRRTSSPAPQRYLRLERGHGRFSRAFSFGQAIDANAIVASFERGLLTITIPKADVPSDRRITIE